MRTEVWLWLVYFAIVGTVIGAIWLRHRHNDARLQEVSERAARLTPIPRAPRHAAAPRQRPAGSTVYWSKEAIKDTIIREYDSSRTTVMQRPARIDQDLLQRVASVARSIGQNDWLLMQKQDHEPDMSQDFDISRCGPLRIIKNTPENRQVEDDADTN